MRARAKGRASIGDLPGATSGDFSQDRETNRVSRLSEEDRAWESASQQRSRDATARDESSTGPVA
jgi:hypothetical protein